MVLGRWWLRPPPRPSEQRVPALDRRAVITAAVVVLAAAVLGAVAGLITADGTLFGIGFRALTWGCGAAAASLLAVAVVHSTRSSA